MSNSLPLIFLSMLCAILGQLVLKTGMTQVGRIDAESLTRPFQTAISALCNPLIVGGLGLYVLGAAFWLTVLSRVPLSFAYPILALSYAITPILAWLLLGENVPSIRWFGVAVICLGVVLISRS